MSRKIRNAVIVGAISVITHFVAAGYPSKVIFDETYFGLFASNYFTHTYYFDIHPPFAKLLIAFAGWVFGYVPGFSFASIGLDYPNLGYLALRFVPMLAGAILPLIVYGIALELDCGDGVALLTGLMVAFENSLIAESRAILTDAVLVATGFACIYFFLRWWNGGRRWNLFASGLMGAASISTKWVGISYLGLVGLYFLGRELFGRRHARSRRASTFALGLLALVVVPAVFYVGVFAIHFALVGPPPDAAGGGFWTQFVTLNASMYDLAHNVGSHPYASTWYEWPFMVKPILYLATNLGNGWQYVIYFIGNPLLWICGFFGIAVGLFVALVRALRHRLDRTFAFVVVGYLANLVPFVFVQRTFFLYHYSAAFIFSLLAFAIEFHWLLGKFEPRTRRAAWGAFLALVVVSFLVVAPFTYGIPVPYSYLQKMGPLLQDHW